MILSRILGVNQSLDTFTFMNDITLIFIRFIHFHPLGLLYSHKSQTFWKTTDPSWTVRT